MAALNSTTGESGSGIVDQELDARGDTVSEDAVTSGGASLRTLRRGLDILLLFLDRPACTQSEISEATGLAMPTVHRLCATLVESGFLVREEPSRQLRLGITVLELAGRMLTGMTVPDLATEHLRALAESTGETVNLGILVGADVVYLRSSAGARFVGQQVAAGVRAPAYCMAIGKCMLAQLSDEEARSALGPEPYPQRTPYTLTTWTELAPALAQIRRTGVAESDQEYELGLFSVAVATPRIGTTPSAISVSPPTARASPAERRALSDALALAADAIRLTTRLLG